MVAIHTYPVKSCRAVPLDRAEIAVGDELHVHDRGPRIIPAPA